MIVADGKEDASVEGRQAAPSLRLCVGGGARGDILACSRVCLMWLRHLLGLRDPGGRSPLG